MKHTVPSTVPETKPREIARLLRKLTLPDIFLTPSDDVGAGSDISQIKWRLTRSKQEWRKELRDVPGDMVLELRRRDLIQIVESGFWTINAAGRAWLKRFLSGSDPFQAQQMDVVKKTIEVDGLTRVASFNLSESPLAWLRRRHDKDGIALIDDAQFTAGERLRSDFTYAHMSPQVTTNWNAIPDFAKKRRGSAGNVEILDSIIESKRRFNRAIRAVGPELSNILVDVCCFLKGLEETETKYKWPRRSAKLILQMALTRLARHYGYEPSPNRNMSDHRAVRHWGSEDFRPKIDGEL